MTNQIRLTSFLAMAVVALGALHATAHAQQKAALPELWGELQVHVDSEKAKVGDKFNVIASQSWVYRTCGVSAGAMLEGKVVSMTQRSDAPGATSVSVSFLAPCENGAKAPMILIAVFYATADDKDQMEVFNSLPQGIGPGASGRQATNLDAMPSAGKAERKLPLAKIGEVKGMRHLSLGVGKGEKGSTVLSSTDKRIRLDKGTRLAFVPVPQVD